MSKERDHYKQEENEKSHTINNYANRIKIIEKDNSKLDKDNKVLELDK